LSDLTILHFFQVAKDDGFPQIRRKLLQRRLQEFPRFPALQHPISTTVAGGFLFEHRQLVFNRIRHALRLRTTVVIDQQITRQTAQPDRERTFSGAKTLERSENPQEHLLRQILCLVV
jgi:hypothetical protein